MKILLTNDDGIHAPNLSLMKNALADIAECIVVAPADERSASSHAISLSQHIGVRDCLKEGSFFGYEVDGTPADCVKVALCKLLSEAPDMIIAGINRGPNTGVSVYYSGTVSAAREGTIADIPSIAVSMCSFTHTDFEYAVAVVKDLAQKVLAKGLPSGIMLNVNIPPLPRTEIKGIKITKQAHSRFIEKYMPEREEAGIQYYSLSGELEVIDADENNDETVVKQGYVSISPLQLDLTAVSYVEDMKMRIDHCV